MTCPKRHSPETADLRFELGASRPSERPSTGTSASDLLQRSSLPSCHCSLPLQQAALCALPGTARSLCLAVPSSPPSSSSLPSSLTDSFCQPASPAATCRLQDVPWLPLASPLKSKRLCLVSSVPSKPQPHLSPFPNTRSAPAKLVCLLSPCPCCHTGHFSHSWRSFPHLCHSVWLLKAPG